MRVACAFDHAGFPLKSLVLEVVAGEGHEAVDLGTNSTDPVDYPDVARAAADTVREGRAWSVGPAPGSPSPPARSPASAPPARTTPTRRASASSTTTSTSSASARA
jgi:Ribose/Galactose Isomerase